MRNNLMPLKQIFIGSSLTLCIFLGLSLGCDQRPELCEDVPLGDLKKAQSAKNIEVPKIIWAFWDGGEKEMPPFHSFNINNLRLKLEPKGYKIVVTNLVPGDPNNIYSLLADDEQLREIFENIDQKAVTYKNEDGHDIKMHPAIVKSDYARLGLLQKYGGIWMDGTNVLVKDIEDLNMQAFIKSEQSVAGYVMDGYASENSVRINNKPVDGMENWLLIAKPNSRLVKAWKTAFAHYWKTRSKGQQINLHPMYYCKNFDFGRLSIAAANYLNQHAALKYILNNHRDLGNEIFPLDFNPWWLHVKAASGPSELDEATRIFNLVTGPDKYTLAEQAKQDNIVLLKFAGEHIKKSNLFKTGRDYCKVTNFFSLLFPRCDEDL